MKFLQPYLHLLLIFLSLTVTSPALTKFAKPGCNDKCGNVTIPYPFGIGADCYVNPWYVVDCISFTPYLPAVDNLKVLGVDLENQTITVSAPKISKCQHLITNSSQTTSIDLGTSSPFFFSKSHNKFVFEGCGSAVMMDKGSVVTGCSNTCLDVTVGDRNNCLGIGCCQNAIPYYLKSYTINLIGSEREGEDGGCGSAFLVDETSFNQRRFSDPFIPVSFLWTLTDSDQVTCCDDETPDRFKVAIFNGYTVDTLKCKNHYTVDPLISNPYLIDGCREYEGTPQYAKTGCHDMCGNVRISYPFGIGASCSLNQWYTVDCNSSTPYLPALNNLKVLGVDLENQTITLSTQRITDCQNPFRNSSEIMGIDLGSSPFLFSKYENKFVFKGCGNAVMMDDDGRVVTGCSTTCLNVTTLPNDRSNCFLGIRCCETTIPGYLKSYNIKLTGIETCGSALLVDKASYDEETS